MSNQHVIKLNNLEFSYPQAPDQSVLSIGSWEVQQGEHVFLYGPSGSGKSTLLNLLTGMVEPSSGSVAILDTDLSSLKNKQKDKFRAQHIGFVFQQLNLIPYLSVKDNILLADFFTPKSSNKADVDAYLTHLIERLNLPLSILEQPASQLSVGQQQRVAIARAMINKPELLIADEPTSALDQNSRDAFIELLFKLVEESNATLVFVSHDKTLASHFGNVLDIESINQVQRQTQDVC